MLRGQASAGNGLEALGAFETLLWLRIRSTTRPTYIRLIAFKQLFIVRSSTESLKYYLYTLNAFRQFLIDQLSMSFGKIIAR